jgi:hypothetical protein
MGLPSPKAGLVTVNQSDRSALLVPTPAIPQPVTRTSPAAPTAADASALARLYLVIIVVNAPGR